MGYEQGPLEDFVLLNPEEGKKLKCPCNFNTYFKNL